MILYQQKYAATRTTEHERLVYRHNIEAITHGSYKGVTLYFNNTEFVNKQAAADFLRWAADQIESLPEE